MSPEPQVEVESIVYGETMMFDILVESCLSEWPNQVSTERIVILRNGKYEVPELFSILEELFRKNEGVSDEAFRVAMHESIRSVIHGVAYFVSVVKPRDIRINLIRAKFDMRMREGLDSIAIGWSDDDCRIARLYIEEMKIVD